MPRYQLPRAPKGTRFGKGRAKGTPNRVTVEARQLVSELVNDVDYQHKLRRDFRARKLHPTMESLVWAYHLGKPRQDVSVTASVDVHARLEEDRRIFAALDISDLEQLAAESQRLVDKAMALSKLRAGEETTPDTTDTTQPPTQSHIETQAISPGSDKESYVELGEGVSLNVNPPNDDGPEQS